MKKNKFMRLASGLLVGTLLTTCAISGTFAKYTTQDAAQDSARVAKWGVELQIIGSLYGGAYTNDTHVPTIAVDDTNVSVWNQSTDGKNVVAPGTKSDKGMSISLNGKPEVDTQLLVKMTTENIFLAAGSYGVMVKIDPSILTDENFEKVGKLYTKNASGAFEEVDFDAATLGAGPYYTLEDAITTDHTYYPVVYNIAGLAGDLSTNYGNNTETGKDDGTAEDTLKAIAIKIGDSLKGSALVDTTDYVVDGNNAGLFTYEFASKVYDTNFDLADLKISDLNLSWNWNFTDEAGIDGDEAATDDKDDCLDTILGNLMAGAELDGEVVELDGQVYNALEDGVDYNLDTQFSIDITVNQVD